MTSDVRPFITLSIAVANKWTNNMIIKKVTIKATKPPIPPVKPNHSYNLSAVKEENFIEPHTPNISAINDDISFTNPVEKPDIREIPSMTIIIISIQFMAAKIIIYIKGLIS